MATVLLDEGYEPEFIAGILGNIIHEVLQVDLKVLITNLILKKPGYLKYMDANHDYRNKFSGKTLTEVGIAETYSLLKQLEKVDRRQVWFRQYPVDRWPNNEIDRDLYRIVWRRLLSHSC